MSAGKDMKGRSSSSAKSGMPGFAWFLAGAAIGLFVALLVYLDRQPAEKVSFPQAVMHELEKAKDQRRAERENKKDKKAATKESSEKESTAKHPKFDFYTILPELEVFIPESEIKTPDNDKDGTPSGPSTTPGKSYLIQAGSFRRNSEAEKRKAELALLGVQSHIQSVSINGEDWYRVRVGPFVNATSLHEASSVLRKNDIQYLTTELK